MRRLPYLILGLLLTCQGYVWAGTVEVREEGTIVDYPYSLDFVGCGTVTVTDSIATVDLSACGGGASSNSFETIDVPAGTDPVADSATDTLTITENTFLTFTGTAGTDTIAVTQVTTDIGTDGLIAANAVALTTDTTGNYVRTIGDCTASEGGDCFNGSNGSQLIFEGPIGVNQIFEFDTGSADFEMENDLTLQDADAIFRMTDTSPGEDDFTLNVNTSALTLVNVTDSVTYLTAASTHAITIGHASVPSVTITTDGTGTAELVVPNDSITLTTETAGNYVQDVADGTGIDGTAAGEGATYTPTLDLTEISSATLGAGAFTTLTFDAGATDPVLTAASGSLAVSTGNFIVDTSTLFVDSTNDIVGIGTVTPSTIGSWGGGLTIASDTGWNSMELVGGGSTTAGIVAFTHGGTVGSPTTTASNTEILEILANGYGTVSSDEAAAIQFWLDGEAGTAGDATDMPGKIVFATTPNGSGTLTDRLTIDSTGLSTFAGAVTATAGTVTLATVAGAIDAGGATSLEVPNGTNPTTDADGEVAVDTSSGSGAGYRFYAGAAYTLPAYQPKSFPITGATTASDFGNVWRVPYNITIRAVHCLAVGGTNVVGQLQECDSSGASCADVDSDMTCTAGSNVNDDGSLSNATLDAGDYLGVKTTSVSGTNTRITWSYEYTVDQVN